MLDLARLRAGLVVVSVAIASACGGRVDGGARDDEGGPWGADDSTSTRAGEEHLSLDISLTHEAGRVDDWRDGGKLHISPTSFVHAGARRGRSGAFREGACDLSSFRQDENTVAHEALDVGPLVVTSERTTFILTFEGGHYRGPTPFVGPGERWRDGEPLLVSGGGNDLLPAFTAAVRAASTVTVTSHSLGDATTPMARGRDLEVRWTPAEQPVVVRLYATDFDQDNWMSTNHRSADCHGSGGIHTIPAWVVEWVLAPDWDVRKRAWTVVPTTRESIVTARGSVTVSTTTSAIGSCCDLTPIDFR